MEGTAAQGRVTVETADGHRFLGDMARPGDDAELRRLLRDNPMPGAIAVSLQREPDFFLGSTVEGDVHQTIVGRLAGDEGRLVGLASRSVRDAWLNGEVGRLGYLSALRIDRRFRGSGGTLREGYRMMRELHEAGDTPYYVTTIIGDNKLARTILERDRPWKPTYRRWGAVSTLVLPLWLPRIRPRPRGLEVRRAREGDRADIVACLQRVYRAYQLAPLWTEATLTDTELARGLQVEDFTIALRRGRVVGCVAAWDQQGYKQAVIQGYDGWMRRLRPAVNLAAPLLRMPRLPDPGQPLRQVYLSHLAVEDEEPGVALPLLGAAYNDLLGRGLAFATLGLAEGNALLPLVKRALMHIEYRSILYLVHWEDGADAVELLDRRVPHVEVATL